MICPNCGNLEYEVDKTIRGINYDLRRVTCPKCEQTFYQALIRVEQREFINLRAKTIKGSKTELKLSGENNAHNN